MRKGNFSFSLTKKGKKKGHVQDKNAPKSRN